MERLFSKLVFLWVGNIFMWLYYGCKKSIDEVAKVDNTIAGIIVTVILVFICYSLFT
jgi:hypothetical protein